MLGKAAGRTTAGNRIVVGTDPVLHDGGDYTSANARGTIIRQGIAYAGAHTGATGMYFDSTCGDSSSGARTVAVLTAMSTGAGSWTIDTSPPCGGSVSLIASNPAFSDLTTTSLQGWSCSVHESFPTFPTDWSALAVATDTATKPTCGIDPGTSLNACGEAYILIAGSAIVVGSQVISVTPLGATNPVGSNHTVTANVHVIGGAPPVVGQLVDFTVTGQNAGATGTCLPANCKSDVDGNVAFTYADAAGAGDDTIKASFTDSAGSLQTATAQKHWVAGGNTPPVASAQTLTTPQDTPLPVTLSGTDADPGDTLTSAVATSPAHGTLTGTPPALTYTPAAGYVGPDSFTFTVNDGHVDSAPATVSITVTAVSGCAASAPTEEISVSSDQTTAANRLVSPKFSTHGGDLIIALVSADGPLAPTQKVTRLSGGGLTWMLSSRANQTWGTTEIWQAQATAPLTDAQVTAQLAKGRFDGSITVTAFTGAGSHVGVVGAASGISTTPTVSLIPSGCNSAIWAVGHDWSHAKEPVVEPGQTLRHKFIDRRVHDSYWVQTVEAPTTAGTSVTASASIGAKDRWTMVAVEVITGP